MRIVRTCILAFAATSIIVVAAAHADEPLRWKLKAGDRLGYNIVQEMTISTVAGGADQLQSETRQELDVSWQVREVTEDGSGVVLYQLDRIRSQMTLPNSKLEYDSAKQGPPTGMAAINAPLYSALIKSPVEFVLSPTGVTLSVTLPESVQAALKRVQTASTLGDLAKADIFHSRFLPGFPQLPGDEVEPGRDWSAKSVIDLGPAGKQSVETKYRYEGAKEVDGVSNAVIRVGRTIAFEPGQTSQRRIKEQSSEGEVIFDTAAGRMRTSTLKQHSTIAITAAKQEVEQKIDQSIEVKFVFVAPKALIDTGK